MMKLEPAGTRTILNPESKPLLACGRSIINGLSRLQWISSFWIHWPTIDVQIGKTSDTSCTNTGPTGPRVGSCRILSESPNGHCSQETAKRLKTRSMIRLVFCSLDGPKLQFFFRPVSNTQVQFTYKKSMQHAIYFVAHPISALPLQDV